MDSKDYKKWMKDIATFKNKDRNLDESDFEAVEDWMSCNMEQDIKKLISKKHPNEIKIKINIYYR